MANNPTPMKHTLVGKNYVTPDLMAKVTGKAKYAEDYRADGMLFCKLLLSPYPHARVKHIDKRAALAMPGVKAIITVDDLPAPADSITDLGMVIKADLLGERGLTNEPVYQGEPILAVAAVDELTAAEAIEKIHVEYERLPFVIDPLDSLRPGGPNARVRGQRLDAEPAPAEREAGTAPAAGPGHPQVDRRGFCRRPGRPVADGQGDRRMDAGQCGRGHERRGARPG